jgi:HSP20 family protein
MTKAQTQKIHEPEKKETALTETKKAAAREPLDAFNALTLPFTFLRRFTEEVEKLFADLGVARDAMPFTDEWLKAAWSPKVEIHERGDKLFVSADLPGMKPEDIKIEVLDNRLTIEGERRREQEEKGKGFYRSERRYGSFYRDIPLPKYVNAEQTKANFKNGVLEITLPVIPKPKNGKRVEISG